MRITKWDWFTRFLLCVVVVGVLFTSTSLLGIRLGRDSGVFLYAGWRILEGEVPYRDVWDHKPPLIYFLDALGLLIGQGSTIGVWTLEVIFIVLAAVIGYALMKKELGRLSAFFGSVAWIMSLVLVLDGGNLTEEFGLFFQFIALYLFVIGLETGRHSWRNYLLGLTGALAFLLKPNLIGIWVAIGAYLVINLAISGRWRDLVEILARVAVGAGLVLVILGIYLTINDAIGNFYDQVWRYNRAFYTTWHPSSRADNILNGLRILSSSGMGILAPVTWIMGVVFIFWRRDRGDGRYPLLIVALVALPLEFLFSRHGFLLHYYISWLPIFAVLTALFANFVLSLAESAFIRRSTEAKRVKVARITLAILLVGICVAPLKQVAPRVTDTVEVWVGHEKKEQTGAIKYILEVTDEDDRVLIWGTEARIHFLSKRASPSQYVYLTPLFSLGYTTGAALQGFAEELQLDPPKLIFDASASDIQIPPLDEDERVKWLKDAPDYLFAPGHIGELDPIFEFISLNYEYTTTVDHRKFPVYALKGDP